MNVDDGFEAQLRETQKRRVLVAVAGGVGVLVLLCVGLLVSALGSTPAAPAPAANPDHRAMLKASIRAQRSALSSRPAAAMPAEPPAPIARAAPAAPAGKPAPVAKAPKARKSSGKHAAAAEASDLKRPASIADPVGPPPAKTVASAPSTGGSRGDEPADPN